jgi:hypothetical protein
VAFAREERLWGSLDIADNTLAQIKTVTGPSTFVVSVKDHVSTLKDYTFVFSLVVVYTYSLAEAFARTKLGMAEQDELEGGIESWGKKLLNRTGHTWSDVLGGQSGVVEVSCVRNAIAHGGTRISASMVSRFKDNGLICPWSPGATIALDYDLTETYRSRLKSLMRLGSNRRNTPATSPSKIQRKARDKVSKQITSIERR